MVACIRVIGHEGNENQNVWVLCENIPVLVSAQNIRPAGDAEALAHAILHGHSIFPRLLSEVSKSLKTRQLYLHKTVLHPKEAVCRQLLM